MIAPWKLVVAIALGIAGGDLAKAFFHWVGKVLTGA